VKRRLLKIGEGAEKLRGRLWATRPVVWSLSGGTIISFLCYLLSFFKRAPLPLLWVFAIGSACALILALLDAGPGRHSVFARSVQYGLAFAAVNFSRYAQTGSQSLTVTIVESVILGVLMALAFRFYIYDPREKTRSGAPSRPLH
jgi:hypothetical protein